MPEKHPFITDLYRWRNVFRDKAHAHDAMAKAYRGMADVSEADDVRQSYTERATTSATLADMSEESARRYDRIAFDIDDSEGDDYLIAVAEAAQILFGFDNRDDLVDCLENKADLTEDEAQRAATLFWVEVP